LFFSNKLNLYVYQKGEKAYFYSFNDDDSKELFIVNWIQIKSFKIQDKEAVRILCNKWDKDEEVNYITLFLI